MRHAVVVAAVVVSAGSAVAAPFDPIELWTRAPGRYDVTPTPPRLELVTVERPRLHEGPLADAQYGTREIYRYALLDEILAAYAIPPSADTALLHFHNGMIIPLPFRNRYVMERLRPAVAYAIQRDGKWSTALPQIRRDQIGFADARPTRFSGNKLVVADAWHPDLLPESEASFSPWRYADTLVGIEFVVGDAWRAQFDIAPEAHAGFAVYEHVCAFCHGARGVGAQLGWDYVDPLPVVEYKTRPVSLDWHVRYRATDAPSRGLLMPALPFLTHEDTANVFAWLRALAERPLNAYAPRTNGYAPRTKE